MVRSTGWSHIPRQARQKLGGPVPGQVGSSIGMLRELSGGHIYLVEMTSNWVSQVALVVKNPPANAEDIRDVGLILGSERSPEGGHGSPLQYPCLENPTDRGDCQAVVHRVEQSQTQLN